MNCTFSRSFLVHIHRDEKGIRLPTDEFIFIFAVPTFHFMNSGNNYDKNIFEDYKQLGEVNKCMYLITRDRSG